MIDTLKLRLTHREVEGADFLNEVMPYLNPGWVRVSKDNGNEEIKGKLGNLCVNVKADSVIIYGSFCKWLLGDNYKTMTREDIKQSIDRLSAAIHLPIERAIVTRLDVGLSIPVNEPIENYFNHLGELSRYKRLEQATTLYYDQQSKKLCFYDKNKEQRDHRETIPEQYQDTNVLRYELRYTSKLKKQLVEPEITAGMLYNEQFYTKLKANWIEAYKQIIKVNTTQPNAIAMNSRKNFFKLTCAAWVEQMGGMAAALKYIKEAQRRGDINDKEACRRKKDIIEAYADSELTIPCNAISELDSKIAAVM